MKIDILSLILSLILLLSLSSNLLANERDPEMDIVIVRVGEIDQKVIQILKDDLNKVFGRLVWVGKGMPEPYYALTRREISIFLP